MSRHRPLPSDVRSRSIGFGVVTPAMIRSLVNFTRNTKADTELSVGLAQETMKNGDRRCSLILSLADDINIQILEDGRWKSADE